MFRPTGPRKNARIYFLNLRGVKSTQINVERSSNIEMDRSSKLNKSIDYFKNNWIFLSDEQRHDGLHFKEQLQHQEVTQCS